MCVSQNVIAQSTSSMNYFYEFVSMRLFSMQQEAKHQHIGIIKDFGVTPNNFSKDFRSISFVAPNAETIHTFQIKKLISLESKLTFLCHIP